MAEDEKPPEDAIAAQSGARITSTRILSIDTASGLLPVESGVASNLGVRAEALAAPADPEAQLERTGQVLSSDAPSSSTTPIFPLPIGRYGAGGYGTGPYGGATPGGVTFATAEAGVITTQVDELKATDLTVGSPTLGTPELRQVHALKADDLVTDEDAIFAPEVRQTPAPRVVLSITQRIAQQPADIRHVARALVETIRAEIDRLQFNKPNGERLAEYNAQIDFLDMVMREVARLADALDELIAAHASGRHDQESVFLGVAGQIAEQLKHGCIEFVTENRKKLAGCMISFGLGAAAYEFLTVLGVDPKAVIDFMRMMK